MRETCRITILVVTLARNKMDKGIAGRMVTGLPDAQQKFDQKSLTTSVMTTMDHRPIQVTWKNETVAQKWPLLVWWNMPR